MIHKILHFFNLHFFNFIAGKLEYETHENYTDVVSVCKKCGRRDFLRRIER